MHLHLHGVRCTCTSTISGTCTSTTRETMVFFTSAENLPGLNTLSKEDQVRVSMVIKVIMFITVTKTIMVTMVTKAIMVTMVIINVIMAHGLKHDRRTF